MQISTPPALGDFGAIALALGLGLLIGVQRGWARRDDAPGSRFAGVRTYGLIGLAGGIAGTLQERAAGLSLVLTAAVTGLVLMGYWRATRSNGTVSGTGSLVGLLTIACGFLAGSGETALATAVTGSIALVLALRTKLHSWIETLDEREIIAIARFGLIALVILPLLPSGAFGPWGVWQPRQLWLVVVMVSGFSFAGYLAAKYAGARRGTVATAATGSMVSSTAVTAALSGKLRNGDGDSMVLNGSIAVASAVMFLRVMVLAAVLAPVALPTLALFAVPGMAVSLIGAVILLRGGATRPPAEPAAMKLRNPFDLPPALLLTVMVMGLTLAARWVLEHFGDRGVALVLAVSGTVDVDSAIITLGNLPVGTLTPKVAGLLLAAPIIANTLLKAGIALVVGGRKQGWPGAATLVASVAASGGVVAVLLLT